MLYFGPMTFNLTLLLCDNMLVSSSTLAAEIFNFAQAMARASKHPVRDVVIRRVTPDGLPVQPPRALSCIPPTVCRTALPAT